jgi:hypothetical protein
VDEGAVDAALSREELSVVDAVFVLEAPLPLYRVSVKPPHSVVHLATSLTDYFPSPQTYYLPPSVMSSVVLLHWLLLL